MHGDFRGVVSPTSVVAQQAALQQAVYTAEQAEAGAAVYESTCVSCHQGDLRGPEETPELAGASFRSVWGSQPVGALLEYTRSTMPESEPGSLSDEEYAAVTAYTMLENGVQPGAASLSFSTPGVVALGAGTELAGAVAERVPIPGFPGNVPTPAGRNAPPDAVGENSDTPTSVTETFHAVEGFNAVSDAELRDPPAKDWLHWRGNPAS